ncbi:MAG: hypothetical protein GY764_00030 [Halieaceae bacterium]|nr:hypothetical protein [Halieaceae bacterium]
MKRLHTLGAALLLSTGAASVHAAPIMGPTTLDELLSGETIQAGNMLFSDFVVDHWMDLAYFTEDADYTQIDVTPLNDGGMDPGPGLLFEFNNVLSVAGFTDLVELAEFIDFEFSFTATSQSQLHPIKDVSLEMVGELVNPTDPVSGAFVEEWVGGLVDPIAFLTREVSQSVDQSGESTSADFGPSQSIRVTKDILVAAEVDGQTSTVVSVEQRFSLVPTPATSLLFGLGLAIAGFLRRRV